MYTSEKAWLHASSTSTHLSPMLQPLFKGLVIVLFNLPHLFPDEATTALSDVQPQAREL